MNDIRYARYTARRLRPRLGLPVVASNASEKFRYVAGKKTTPTHCILSQKLIAGGEASMLLIDSETNTITVQIRIRANVRATRSRRLNVKTKSNSEKAVIAIPAVRISVSVLIKTTNLTYQLVRNKQSIIQTYSNAMTWRRTAQYPDWKSNDRYNHKIHTPIFAPIGQPDDFLTAFLK